MSLREGNERAEGGRFDPGVLVQEVNVIVALVEGVAHAHVVGRGKAEVVGAAGEFRFREVGGDEVRGTVDGVIVPDVQVRRDLRGADAPEAPVQPLQAVVRDDDDKNPHDKHKVTNKMRILAI